MTSYSDLKCWEIIYCDNLDCPARSEADTPCWEIAKRIEAYRNISNTCRDCIVYLLKKETSGLSNKEVHEILKSRMHSKKIGTNYLACTLKISAIR